MCNFKERSRTLQAFNIYRPIVERAKLDGRAWSKGRFWYQMNGARIEKVAQKHSVPVERSVAACSALSPLTPWDRCFDGTVELIRNAGDTQRTDLIRLGSEYTVFNRSVTNAVDLILGNVDPIDALSGPKVWNFYRNLMGNLDPVTVDSWMYKIVGKFGLQSATPTDNARRSIKRSIRMLATMWDLKPAQVQAVIWCHARNYSES